MRHAVELCLLLALSWSMPAHGQATVFENGFENGDTCQWSDTSPGGCTPMEHVTPARIDDVLVNPGMGFANFHFGWWCNLPPITFTPEECAPRVLSHWPENYPGAGTAYFRWHWKDLEPVRGQIDFDLIDTTIQSANVLGETLSFRVMTIDDGDGVGVPEWLRQAPYNVPDVLPDDPDIYWPDYRHATFQAEHQRFVQALGARYNDHPGVDHVDIGSVGCWGEWNTACLDGAGGIFGIFAPQNTADNQTILTAYQGLIDHYVDSFTDTPVVMLGLGYDWELQTMLYATSRGAGWRVDCWGDWGFWGSWTHQTDAYPDMLANAAALDPTFSDLWKQAPIQLEVCGVMQDWHDFGWTTAPPDGNVYKTFQWALDQHASVLNAKFSPVPADYVPAVDELLKQNGYRFVIDSFSHRSSVFPGQEITFSAVWSNIGVAPAYRPRDLTYRLRNAGDEVTFQSAADIRTWLPGSWPLTETFTVPSGLPSGVYNVEIAILDRAGTNPTTAALPPLFLGIEGRRIDGWYAVSQVTVQ